MSSILVVDDEPHATRVLKLRLEGAGHDVVMASDGQEALEKMSAKEFEVLVTDICMPRMNGRELCEEVRKKSMNDGPYIIILTSRPEDEFRVWTRDFPNLEFMEKPVSLQRLIARIDEQLAGRSTPGDSQE